MTQPNEFLPLSLDDGDQNRPEMQRELAAPGTPRLKVGGRNTQSLSPLSATREESIIRKVLEMISRESVASHELTPDPLSNPIEKEQLKLKKKLGKISSVTTGTLNINGKGGPRYDHYKRQTHRPR